MGRYTCEKILFELVKGNQYLQPDWFISQLKHQIWLIFNRAPSSITRKYTSQLLQWITYNLRLIGRMMRYFSPTNSIDERDLYVADIEVKFLHYLVSYISQKYFNMLRSIFYMENLPISQRITFNKYVMTWKRNLVTAISRMGQDKVMSKSTILDHGVCRCWQ